MTVGVWFARITGLSMFLAYAAGAFFTLRLFCAESHYSGDAKALWRADDDTER